MAETIVETARLRLRTWDACDIAPFMTHLNTPAVTRWLGGVQDEASFHAVYERLSASQNADGFSFWIIERLADEAMLGFCGLKRVDAEDAPMIGDVEIGWRLREDAWGMGYAREAAEATLGLAFNHFDLGHVVAMTVPQNAASWGLMQRIGMVRARNLDFTFKRLEPEIQRHIVYRITKGDWTI